MCYRIPGPRCTSHAREALKTAKRSYRDDPTSENYERLDAAQKDLDSTRGGQSALRKEMGQMTLDARIPDGRRKQGFRTRPLTEEEKLKMELLHKRLIEGKQRHEEAVVALKNLEGAEQARARGVAEPVLVTPSKLREPWTMHDLADYDGGVDVSIRYQDTRGSYGDYYSDGEHEEAYIENIDTRRVLATVFSCTPGDISDDLVSYAESKGIHHQDAYEIDYDNDYYGVTTNVSLKPEHVESLRNYYYQKPNANDNHGVLSYARSKGIQTAGLTPLEALKTQLRAENNDMRVRMVESATRVSLNQIPLKDIYVPHADRLAQVDARSPVGYGNSASIAGVLVKDRNGRYVIVDGYHRLKSLNESNKKSAAYLVLEGSEIPQRIQSQLNSERPITPARAVSRGGGRRAGSKAISAQAAIYTRAMNSLDVVDSHSQTTPNNIDTINYADDYNSTPGTRRTKGKKPSRAAGI